MSDANNKNANMGKTKRSTDDLINDALAQQNDWLENRRTYTRGFLKSMNKFAKTSEEVKQAAAVDNNKPLEVKNKKSGLRAYWFPIMCALIVIFIAIWVAFVRVSVPSRIIIVPKVAEPTIQRVQQITVPEFDIVRIEKSGKIIIAGRWLPHQNISIMVNGKIIATERTNVSGEFVYSPINPWDAGNYTIALLGDEPEVKSSDKVFLYISDAGADNSVSLLMTKNGSTLLQAPTALHDGDLSVSKIDYLDTGRIVVNGDGMPRLRVSLSLNDKYLGFARVSDHRHFGLGADVDELQSGQE
ncbi:MAG: hypothetical protein IKW67_03120, partial [Alphaproteobacteria bacterium]|nr:hypothetical protein [Alphaproteobacteria bacterium]